MLRTLLLCLSLLCLSAGDLPDRPFLRLETGMHTGGIRRLGVDVSGRHLVTVSDDKTLRLWDVERGTLVSIIRPPLGEGNVGRLYACAMSPDGTLVAAGGWTDDARSIYLFDRASGRMVRRISGLPNVTYHLVFSRDGLRLGATLGSGGVRIFRVSDGRELARDEDYAADSFGGDFDENGRFATTCWDGYLRLYEADGRLRKKLYVGGSPFGIRFAPSGPVVAVGFNEPGRVELRSSFDLSPYLPPDLQGCSGDLFSVGWSLDGKTLYATGLYAKGQRFHVRAWGLYGRGAPEDFPVAWNTVMDLAALPGGRMAWGAAGPGWGVLGGASRFGVTADFRDVEVDLGVQGKVSFAYGRGKPASTYDPGARELRPGLPRTPSSLQRDDLSDWKDRKDPKFQGRAITLKINEISRSRSYLPKGGFLLGADWTLYAFDAQGKERWRTDTPGVVWALAADSQGELAVAGCGDGTLRWFRISDGVELLTFFPHADGQRWLAWTPTGYYDCSPGAEDLIGWHLNRGLDEAADFFPASRFRSRFYRPDVVARVLADMDESQALRLANEVSGRREGQQIQALLPPVVRILSPDPGEVVRGNTVSVKVFVRHPQGLATEAVWALVDGRRVESRGLRPQQGDTASEGVHALEVPFPGRDCLVSVFAQARGQVSEAATLHLRAPAVSVPFALQPKLYVLAIGVGRYRQPGLALDYPAKDARDLARAFEAQQGGLYREVEAKVLTDEGATREEIMDGLEWMERQVTAKDVAVVFLAGHGINDPGGQYYFLPANADPERIKRTMVADSELRSTLAKLPGKVMLFLDTCHSGSLMGAKQRGPMDLNGFINELSSAENGVVVFSASTGKQASQESREWANGAFTKAVVEGLSGRADYQRTGRITLNMLDLYISERVKQLTKGTQSPTTAKPTNVPDFPVAVIAQ